MLTLYLVRHAQSTFNRHEKMCGKSDAELSEKGLEMARSLAEYFRQEEWEALYSSPLKRARQTMEATAALHGLKPQLLGDLSEIDYGAWEGLESAHIQRDDPLAWRQWTEGQSAQRRPPGGESVLEVARRAARAIDWIRSRHPHGQVLAVSHKTTIRVLLCLLLGIDAGLFRARFDQPPCAVNVIEFPKSGPRLKQLGGTAHLGHPATGV